MFKLQANVFYQNSFTVGLPVSMYCTSQTQRTKLLSCDGEKMLPCCLGCLLFRVTSVFGVNLRWKPVHFKPMCEWDLCGPLPVLCLPLQSRIWGKRLRPTWAPDTAVFYTFAPAMFLTFECLLCSFFCDRSTFCFLIYEKQTLTCVCHVCDVKHLFWFVCFVWESTCFVSGSVPCVSASLCFGFDTVCCV